MIITGGTFKGKKIQTSGGENVRPSSALVKKSLFNILYNEIIDSTFLDLFAGSGAVGLEALSRGSEKVIFVESDPNNIKIIENNIKLLGVEDQATLYKLPVEKALEKIGISEPNIIFMDPPYKKYQVDYIKELFNLIHKYKLLNPDGYLILESSADKNVEEFKVDNFELYKNKRYGKTQLSFWIFEELPYEE